MRPARAWLRRLFGVFAGAARDRELAAELEGHLQLHIDDNLRRGMAPAEARRQALLQLGGIDQTKELYRDRRSLPALEALMHDLREAGQRVRRTPAAVFAIVLTLGAAAGLNAAVFAMADSLWLRPFSFPEIERLVYVDETRPDGPYRGFTSPANFLEWQRAATAISPIAGFSMRQVDLGGIGEPERLQAVAVGADFLSLLGITPAYGRAFVKDEETFGRHRQTVLGQRLWVRRFAGDPAIVGTTVVLDDVPHEVVGIAPRNFDFPFGADLWIPLAFDASAVTNRDARFVLAIGRLSSGKTIEAARTELTAVGREIARRQPESSIGRLPRVRPFHAGFVEDGLPVMFGLLHACAFMVLLVACANISNLMLALGADRQREIAVRYALGATRAQIIRALSLESLVIAMLSVPLSLTVAASSLGVLNARMPPQIAIALSGWRNVDIDGRLVLFTIVLTVAGAAMFALLSAIHTAHPNPEALKDAARGMTAGAGRQRLRRSLLVVQVALALPLLAAATATWRGTGRLLNGPQGFQPNGMLTFRLSLPARRYSGPDAQRQFVSLLHDRLAAVSGVRRIAVANLLPSIMEGAERDIEIEGAPPGPPEHRNTVEYRTVSPGYFDTMEIPIRSGRAFSTGDGADSEPVAIVSQSMANRYWPGQDAIGQRFRLPAQSPARQATWIRVVGICGDVVHDWAFARNIPTVHRPFTQAPLGNFVVALRATDGSMPAGADVRQAIHQGDPALPVFALRRMKDIQSDRLAAPRQVSVLLASLSGLALVLTIVGLYGVFAYAVVQRTHEIGLRIALGATARSVLGLILGQAARLTVIGTAIGVLLAVILIRAMGVTLYGVAAVEPALLAGLAFIVALVGVLAAYLPSRRAVAIDPAVALRSE